MSLDENNSHEVGSHKALLFYIFKQTSNIISGVIFYLCLAADTPAPVSWALIVFVL